MKVFKLQVKIKGSWQSRSELSLTENEEVSLITQRGKEDLNRAADQGKAGFCHIKFNANILWSTPEHFKVRSMVPTDQLLGNEVTLSVTKVGKSCHSSCPEYSKEGCPFLKEILFLEVHSPGKLELMETLRYKSSTGDGMED